jgi:hypothetical protein
MIVYKLFRQLKNGDITPLFINKTKRLPFNEWMNAESHPTKGLLLDRFGIVHQHQVPLIYQKR